MFTSFSNRIYNGTPVCVNTWTMRSSFEEAYRASSSEACLVSSSPAYPVVMVSYDFHVPNAFTLSVPVYFGGWPPGPYSSQPASFISNVSLRLGIRCIKCRVKSTLK